MASTPLGRLYKLIELFRNGNVSTEHFCATFETIYNLELDKSTLGDNEAAVMGAIFDKIVALPPDLWA